MNQPEIKTTPNLIKLLGRNLYSQPVPVILVRELLQNSRDATRKNKGGIDIHVSIDSSTDTVEVDCIDAGIGMDYDTLFNTFLTIGKSGKPAEGNVGGFGIAKVSIFSTDWWKVETKNHRIELDVETDGLKYTEMPEFAEIDGTGVFTKIKPEQFYQAVNWATNAMLMVHGSDVTNVKLNGQDVKPYRSRRIIASKTFQMEDGRLETVTIKAAKPLDLNGDGVTYSNLIFWRIGGLVQYTSSFGNYGDDYGINLIVDFSNVGYRPTDLNYPFDMSRERVKYNYREWVQTQTVSLTKNKRTTRSRFAETEAEETKKAKRLNKIRKLANNRIIRGAPEGKIDTTHLKIMNLWTKIVEIVNQAAGDKVGTGLIYDGSVNAVFQGRKTDSEYVLVNPNSVLNMCNLNKGDAAGLVLAMWHLVVHEMSHQEYPDHDEDFTGQEGELARNSSHLLILGLPTLRVRAREILKDAGQWELA